MINFGTKSASKPEKRYELAWKSFFAGKRAKAEGAHNSACKHFQTAIDQLGSDGWQRWHSFALELYTEAAETACLDGDFELMDHLVQQALQEAKSLLDRVKLQEIKLHAGIVRNDLQEAVNVGLEVLKLLGLPVPDGQVEKISLANLLEHTLRKRLEQALQRHTRKLVILNQMNELLRACHTEEETYRVVADTCQELFPESAGCLCMMDEAQIMFKGVASWGNPPLQVAVFGVNESWGFYRGNANQPETNDINLLYTYPGYAPEDGYLCVPVNASGKVMANIALCCGVCPLDQSNAEWLHIMELRRIVLTRVANDYALALENLRLRKALQTESVHDSLTGLYNRRYMEESLKREAYRAEREGYPVGLIMLNVDYFTSFNETYGQPAGDIILKELAALLLRHTRGEDVVCRYSEEEFFLILPDMSADVAKIRAEELRVLVKELRIPHPDDVFAITVSLGVTALPGYSLDAHAGISAAKRALKDAKRRGHDQVATALF